MRTRGRTGFDTRFPRGEDHPTFDQLKSNSEIMRARCAESRVERLHPASIGGNLPQMSGNRPFAEVRECRRAGEGLG